MNCATFEDRLTELMGSELGGAERDRSARELLDHAEDCPACTGCADLLHLLARPSAEREEVPDPGPEYWEAFEGRVRERIRRREPEKRAPGTRWVAAAAAVILLAVVSVWIVRDAGSEISTVADGTEPTGVPAVVGPPPSLESDLASLPPEEASAQLDALTGWNLAAEGDGGLFPDVSDLDAEAEQELLFWLKGRSS